MLQCSFNAFGTVKDIFLYVLLPKTCFCCKRDLPFACAKPLCQTCVESLRLPGPLFCVRCGQTLQNGGAHCYHCRGVKSDSFKCKIIRSAFVFNPPVRALVHAFKYGSHTHLASYMAVCMAQQFSRYGELKECDALVPVPLHPKKLKERGYNQSELLATKLGNILLLPVDTQSLVRNHNTPSQTGFGREGRLENMKGAFECLHPESVKGKTVLLIDDVATTGATLEGCASALRQAGARKVMAYTFSRE